MTLPTDEAGIEKLYDRLMLKAISVDCMRDYIESNSKVGVKMRDGILEEMKAEFMEDWANFKIMYGNPNDHLWRKENQHKVGKGGLLG